MSTDDGPSDKLLIGTAIFGALAALGLLLGALKYIQHHNDSRPIAIAEAPAPQADSPGCQSLSKAYPSGIAGGWRRATVRDPAPTGAAAWRRGDDSLIVRCGVDRPAEFAVGTSVEQVNGVQWFRASDPATATTTWYAVDRGVYVALTAPDGSGSEPLTQISNAVAATLPAVKPNPAPVRQ